MAFDVGLLMFDRPLAGDRPQSPEPASRCAASLRSSLDLILELPVVASSSSRKNTTRRGDRKSGVLVKSVSVSVDLCGCRNINNKKTSGTINTQQMYLLTFLV